MEITQGLIDNTYYDVMHYLCATSFITLVLLAGVIASVIILDLKTGVGIIR